MVEVRGIDHGPLETEMRAIELDRRAKETSEEQGRGSGTVVVGLW